MGAQDVLADPAVSVYFTVTIDKYSQLGAFASCEGLGAEVQIEQREEGGNNEFVHQLPGRIKYTNVKLTRTINKDSSKIAEWFASFAKGEKRATAEIVAMAPGGTKVAQWHLQDVIPVKWSGPSLTLDSAKVCVETLELAHHGFKFVGQ